MIIVIKIEQVYTHCQYFLIFLLLGHHHKLYARQKNMKKVFADEKKHSMGWNTLRGLKKVTMQAMLTFAAM
jgi:hypothetical protein